VPVQLGARLRQGDVVATLDAEGIRRELGAATAAVRAAQAEVQSARVQAAESKAKAARLEKLGDAVSAEELETARYQERLGAARVSAAQARVGEAMAHVEQVRQLLETTALTAPFDGVVADRYKDPGAMVGPGQPIIRLISGDDLWVRFAVPEEEAGSVQVQGCVRVAVSSLPVAATGTVENVAPQIDAASRMLMVEARLALPAEWLGKLPAGVKAQVTAVPCQAPKP
jgi:RND family efflux transporter MFP subunit